MEENVKTIKAIFSAAVAALTALWGWFGWLIAAWVVCMGLDYLSGTAAALRTGTWSSRLARDGIWHKLGCVVAVLISGILDLVVGHLLNQVVGAVGPFVYTVFLCPLVVVWYILTEMGSIVENAGRMGAPIPAWLKRAIAVLKAQVEEQGEDGT